MSTQVRMPRLSQDMESGRVIEWLKREGDTVAQGEVLLVVETDKSNVDVESPTAGVIRRIIAPLDAEIEVGGLLATIAEPGEADEDDGQADEGHGPVPAESTPVRAAHGPSTGAPDPHAAAAASPETPSRTRRPVSPAARRVAVDLGVDLASVSGTGDGGLITEADVRAVASGGAALPAGAGSLPPGDSEIPITGLRRRISERMALSRRTVADVTTVIDVDVTALAAHRRTTGVSYTAYVAWAAARSLRDYPSLNATFRDERLVLRGEVNLGIAVSLDDGLVVPVVRRADAMEASELGAAVEAVAARVRAGELRQDDLSGATFTVTNSGGFGSLFFTPIVNVPEVAILGVGRVADAALVRDGEVVAGKQLYLCLTYDHRVIDGSTAVSFLADVKRRLESVAE